MSIQNLFKSLIATSTRRLASGRPRPMSRLSRRNSRRPLFEQLEDRRLLASIAVTGIGDTIAVDGLVTLREAITSANNNANVNADVMGVGAYGTDTINFNIAGAGVHTITPGVESGVSTGLGGLPTITGPVIIDGYTQGSSTPATDDDAKSNTLAVGSDAVLLIELNGTNAVLPGFGLVVSAGNSTVRGLIINRFVNVGINLQTNGGNLIEGNWIGIDANATAVANNFRGIGTLNGSANNTIGGATPQARNVISGNGSHGILLATSNNVVQGNYIGTNPAGTAMLPAAGSSGTGVQIDSASGNTVGGAAAGAGNVIAGLSSGIHIFSSLSASSGNVIQGNFIGTNATGTAALRNGTGIELGDTFDGVNNTTIGGTAAGAGNLISGNTLGITLNLGTGNVIQGNRIGTAADGTTALGNGSHGVQISGTNNTVGGTAAGAGNTIAFNAGDFQSDGVNVGFGTGNSILGNSIYSNGNLGIDLGGISVTPNDLGDGDTGPNGLQNFPVLTQILASATQTAVQGTLNSTAGGTFRIEFFVNQFPNATSHGEGRSFIDALTVTDGGASDTDARPGFVSIAFTANGDLRGQYLAMTATNLTTNETSEFSLAYAVTHYVVTNTAENGLSSAGPIPGSLRAAITNSNRVPAIDRDGLPGVETDQITFNIPGGGVKTITLVNAALPTITDPVIIDGYTQPGASPNTNLIDQAANAVLRVQLVGLGSTGSGFDGLTIAAGGSTVRGLAMRNFRAAIFLQNAGGNRVVGNYLGTDAAGATAPGLGNFRGVQIRKDDPSFTNVNNTIGGTVPADRNVIASGGGDLNRFAIEAVGTSGLTVQGNFIGTDATGTSAAPSGAAVWLERTTDSLIGGTDPQARNVILGDNWAVRIATFSQRNTVQGNTIGTDRTGTVGLLPASGISSTAIDVYNSSDNLIGGNVPGAGNVISNYGIGIKLGAATPRHTIQGNLIGTDVTGTLNLGNRFAGIGLEDDNSLIGGTVAGAGNTIAFNGAGINVSSSAQRTAILGNSIFGNLPFNFGQGQTSGLGIDLNGEGPTSNDAGDADSGGNTLQNFPEISAATFSGGMLTVTYTVPSSSTSSTYPLRVEFFKTDATGQEGQTLLGFDTYTAAEAGTMKTVSFPSAALAAGDKIVGTATDTANNTSEFTAAPAQIDPPLGNGPPAFTSASVTVATEDAAYNHAITTADPDAGDTRTITAPTLPAWLTLVDNGNGTATLSGAPGNREVGSHDVVLKVTDAAGAMATQSFTVTVANVNDAPSFTAGPDQIVQTDAGPQLVSSWASDLRAGPANEAGQTLQFMVTTDNPSLFSVAPAISANGTLSYTPAPSRRGIASLIVQLRDDGGTENDGQDMSTARTFTITVLANGGGCAVPRQAAAANFLGNVRARMSKGTLTLIGDADNNSISIGAGSMPGYFRVSGVGGTALNGRAAATEMGPITQAIRVRLGAGSDNLVLDGTTGAMVVPGKLVVSDSTGDSVSLERDDENRRTSSDTNSVALIDSLLERGLTVRMGSADDDVSLCGLTSAGRVRVRTGRGPDTVLINDSTMHDRTRVRTGRGPDVVAVETTGDPTGPQTVLQKCVRIRTRRGNDSITLGSPAGPGNSVQTPSCTKIRGGRGTDTLDAGLSSDPNSNGNEFAQPPDTHGIEQQTS